MTQILQQIDLNSKVFCILDLSAAYYAIELHSDSRKYFCFRDADQRLCCLQRVVQGFVESDQHLSEVLHRIFLPGECGHRNPITYQDNFVIADNSLLEDSMVKLIEVLKRLKEAGFKINPKKSKLF